MKFVTVCASMSLTIQALTRCTCSGLLAPCCPSSSPYDSVAGMQSIVIVEPSDADQCLDYTSVHTALHITVNLTATPGTNIVSRFQTSFPVGSQWNGSRLPSEDARGISGSFYTDNGLELIHRHREPP